MSKASAEHSVDELTLEEREFLRRARSLFRENIDWLEFEGFAFGTRSPIFSADRSHRDVLQHPLYIALRDMWLELGVRQGRIAAEKGEETHAARRKASGRR